MFRLARRSIDPEEIVLAASGRIAGEDVATLERAGEQVLSQAQRLTVELEGVRFIDQAGIELLHRWRDRGATLRGASLFIQAILRTPDPE